MSKYILINMLKTTLETFKAIKTKPINEYSHSELGLAILLFVASVTVMTSLLVVAPGIGMMFKIFKTSSPYERRKLKRTVFSLEKQGFLQYGSSDSLKLTTKGIQRAVYESLQIRKQTWDKRWRLVMFDIPETKRGARIALSRKIIEMGMRHVQDSVFISPYPCEEEITTAAKFLHVDKYIQLAVAISISDSTKFKKEFDL